MLVERRDPTVEQIFLSTKGSGDEMIKTAKNLQDLKRRIYVKAKAEPSWRFSETPGLRLDEVE